MRTIDVFFYGLFMDEELLLDKGVSATNVRIASLQGYELRIGNRATLIPVAAGRVFGIIASLTHDDLARLYSDPSVQTYCPEAVLAQLAGGETLAALCFNLIEPPSAEERNPEYATKLRALADRLQFPPDYVASIQ